MQLKLFSTDCTDDIRELRASVGDDYIDLRVDLSKANTGNNGLNTFIQLGDIVEYRKSKQDIPNKGEIVSIGALSSDKIVQVSDGTWLYRSVHLVRRMEIKRLDEDRRLPNPDPVWKSLKKVEVIPPYDDVQSESDSDNDSVDDDEAKDEQEEDGASFVEG